MKSEFKYLEDFINHIDVECPNCGAKALVVSNPTDRSKTRFTCSSCGKNKNWIGNASVFIQSGFTNISGIVLGQPFDCFFKFPLWYRAEIKGNTFFAYNLEHLNFLKEYIQTPLRERAENEHGWSNQSIQSRLPKWLLSAGNREEIVKKISLLEKK